MVRGSGPVANLVGSVLVAGMLIGLAGCVGAKGGGATAGAPDLAGSGGGALTVFAASSLRGVFTEIGARFQSDHPGTTVRFNFAGSADLVAQLQQGAPADALATADVATMDRAAADGLLANEPKRFATNSMMIAVPAGNPAGIATFADLARPGLQVVVCARQVPCGAAAAQVEARSGTKLFPVSQESASADVLTKVATGEADAGVVYVTDVTLGAGTGAPVAGIPIPPKINVTNSYPVATLADARSPQLARQFVAMLVGPVGQAALQGAGFGPAPQRAGFDQATP